MSRRGAAVLAAAAALAAGCGSSAPEVQPGSPSIGSSGAGRVNESQSGTAQVATGGGAAANGWYGTEQGFAACSLVSRRQAGAILGAPVRKPFEAPQGPTCIYRPQQGKSTLTLAVQTASIKQLRQQMLRPRALRVAGRPGYCGVVGLPMLYVPLSHGRVLTVGGRCAVAQRFAATALRGLIP
jgi:hypothetical protein